MLLAILLKVFTLAIFLYAVNFIFAFINRCYILWDVPKIKERFPFSLPFDYLFCVNSREKKVTQQRKLPRNKAFARLLFKLLQLHLPQHFEHPVVRSFYGPAAVVHILKPEGAEALLSSNINVKKGFIYHFLKPWLGKGLLSNPSVDTWKIHRKALTPAIHFRILDDYVNTMNDSSRELVQELKQRDGFVDIYPLLRKSTFAVLFETALGIKLDDSVGKHVQFREDCDTVADDIMTRMLNFQYWPDIIYYWTKVGRESKIPVKRMDDYLLEVIKSKLESKSSAKNIQDLNNNNSKNDVYNLKKSFIDIALELFEDKSFSLKDVRDHTATFIVGGFDTTATSLAFTLHLLGNHKEIQATLQQEIDTIVGNEKIVTKQHLSQMPYMDAVCKESLRLFPPLSILVRDVDVPFNIGKQTIPSGTVAMVHTYFIQRNPNVWRNPDDFQPERFLNGEKHHPFAYIPFSAGPRNCLGQKFAAQEDKIFLAQILKEFNIECQEATSDLRLSIELILRPIDGVHIRLTPRHPPAQNV